MSGQVWGRMRLTAQHLQKDLSSDLYRDHGDCIWEGVKNGACACMPNGIWKPSLARLEIFLVDNHPLGPKSKSLVLLDHGSGFTQPQIDQFCNVLR